ncbi:MAG: leucine--tRNA ligase [Phycisphaeraceae bacterium]|nr:leucine--tRNA ligase [Phycisphaeraceae bacterium]
MKYDFKQIEQRWQQYWEQQKTFRARNPGDEGFDSQQPKFYVLDMFPYPSGVGLHVGHPLGYIATDIVARYKKMRGYNVLHPMGFDAFGLPAEQYAVETGTHPRKTTETNIDNMVRQLKRLGMGYDWDRMIATTDPGYVRWTQWIFLQLYHSYFDPLQEKAMPITNLIEKLEQEQYLVGLDGELIYGGLEENLEALGGLGDPTARKWQELSPQQQQRLLDEYRLAYMADVEVNWCPRLGTVLANEEVTNDGRSERGNYPVFKRPLKQWMLRITAYADRLIEDLDLVDWPEPIKLLQRNWIGRSHGAMVDFKIKDGPCAGDNIRVFTTRPDTLFGATYMVLAPEHDLVTSVLIEDDPNLCDWCRETNAELAVQTIVTPDRRKQVRDYILRAKAKSSIDRQTDIKEKTGVFTGSFAINPVNGQAIPIWIADYVMTGYGTGAIMAVPAHDERDYAFAKKFNLPIVEVVSGGDISKEAYTGDGTLVNSENDEVDLNDQTVPDAKVRITNWLEEKGLGKAQVQFKLRDWLFSRQRYWGEPFPILHGPPPECEIRPVDETDLPVELPQMEDFKPVGSDDPDAPPQPPLGRAPGSWKQVEIDGKVYTRELNTMPNWAGSCWYYLRYIDPRNSERLVGAEAERYWMSGLPDTRHPIPDTRSNGVDLYVGGVEHAVLHLLYARFWHKVLFDLGHVSSPEPFGKLFSQGYIQAYCYRDQRGIAVEAAEVVNAEGKPASDVQGQKGQKFFFRGRGEPVTEEYGKMGKSLKNAIAPDEICEKYGCDTLRLYEMYMGPLEQSKVWNTADIVGVHRFLNRLWRNYINEESGELLVSDDKPSPELHRLLHRTISRVTEAMETMSFNVAIAALIELNNELVSLEKLPRELADTLPRLLSPLAPHVAEQLWSLMDYPHSIAEAHWPAWDEAALAEATIELPVQVNGKLRGRITVPADADQDAIIEAAKAEPNVAAHLEGKTLRKQIVIPGRLVNLVAN